MAAHLIQEITLPALNSPIPADPVVAEDVFNATTLVKLSIFFAFLCPYFNSPEIIIVLFTLTVSEVK